MLPKVHPARRVWVGSALVVGTLVLVVAANYLLYGKPNPFSYPAHIYMYGRRYDAAATPVTFAPGGRPPYQRVSIHLLLGKHLYTQSPPGPFVPAVLYLDIGGGMLLPYALSGSP